MFYGEGGNETVKFYDSGSKLYYYRYSPYNNSKSNDMDTGISIFTICTDFRLWTRFFSLAFRITIYSERIESLNTN